ncbi:unnamed protein product [Pseudo-nitzschia multistriata]|uniref:GPI-anchor transamidase n=1 Tax=Pseudo-nitzschia multistriata TaxID=183589 RepID=A0A448Z5V4_9STRA|nr:unnamed protein product [Pseudo-nitzschia multistriata]
MHGEGIEVTGWYNNRTEIDYRGSDVTVQNFLDSILGFAPKSLQSLNEESNLLIYFTGHGGNQFFKFQDEEELTAQDIANLMDRLQDEKKFKKALLIADTCQAFTIFDKLTTPNVLALGTSLIDENAYAHRTDKDLGLGAIERWTHHFIKNYRSSETDLETTLHQVMVAPFDKRSILMARVGITNQSKFKSIKVSEFFGIKGVIDDGVVDDAGTFVEIAPEALLKLPQNVRDFTLAQSSPVAKGVTANVCFTEEKDDPLQLTGGGVCLFFCVVLLTLVLVQKLEKHLMEI